MPSIARMLENGSIGQTAKNFGKALAFLVLLFSYLSTAKAFDIAVNCYDTSRGVGGFYYIKTKVVNLDTKQVAWECTIADEGEIVNLYPVQVSLLRDTLLLTAINDSCFCKNTAIGGHNTKLAIVDMNTYELTEQRDLPRHIIYRFKNSDENEIFIRGSRFVANNPISIDGIYRLPTNHVLEKIRNVDIDYNPYTRIILAPDELAQWVGDNIYFDVFDAHYYLIKLGGNDIIADTVRLENFESRNMVVALKDTILYVFSLNYETHLIGESYKGYGQNWILANLRRYSVNEFALLDSIPILDYPEGDFINGAYGPAKVTGPYIVYYFGDSNDMGQLYPAMLFIFDTRTNEATWLRVGWR
jgi:hypothetical protein